VEGGNRTAAKTRLNVLSSFVVVKYMLQFLWSGNTFTGCFHRGGGRVRSEDGGLDCLVGGYGHASAV
jgi:hypothetical protein